MGAVYIEEKAVYINNVHVKTIQWETQIFIIYSFIYFKLGVVEVHLQL